MIYFSDLDTKKLVTINNSAVTPKEPKAVANTVIEKVRNWGSGSVGEISVTWKDRNSAHSVSVYNNSGQVIMYDAQSNRMYDESEFEQYFSRTNAGATSLVRFDNARWNTNNSTLIQDLTKMVAKREDD